MKKVIWAGAAVLVLVASGIGGYVYVNAKVREAVDTALNTTLPAHPAVKSLDYDGYDFDLLGNTLTLRNPRIALDLSGLQEQMGIDQPGLSIGGVLNVAYSDLTARGIRGMAFGGTKIGQISFASSSLEGTIVETLQDPDRVTVNDKEYDNSETPLKSATITMTFTGTLGAAHAQGIDIGQAQSLTNLPINLPMDAFAAQDLKLKVMVETLIERKSTPETGAPAVPLQTVPAMDVDITVAKMTLRGITPSSYKLARYENVTVEATPKDTGQQAQKQKTSIGEIVMRDAQFVDHRPVRLGLDITDWVFDTPELKDPQARMVTALLGVDQINLNMKLNYAFDSAKQTFGVQPFRLGLKQVGTFNLAFFLEGMPKTGVFDKLQKLRNNQEQLNAAFEDAFKDIALDEINVGYEDHGVLKRFLASQAKALNTEPAKLADMYAKQGAMILSQAFGKDKSEDIKPELVKFLTTPDAINLRLKAKLPLKLKDFMADFKVSGPNALMAFQLYVITGKGAQLE